MAETATLLAENVKRFCPGTNHYQCSDGKFLLVTVKEVFDVGEAVETLTGLTIPISRSHAPKGTDVFLADERGRVVDADGDPANGMTPVAKFDPGTSAVEALAALGYEVA